MQLEALLVISRSRTSPLKNDSLEMEIAPKYPEADQLMNERHAVSFGVFKVAIYCRTAAACREKIRRQEVQLRNYALMHGWKVASVFVDDGFTGSNCDRPGFMQMIERATQPHPLFDIILVVCRSRIARNMKLYSYWFDVLSARGIQIQSVPTIPPK